MNELSGAPKSGGIAMMIYGIIAFIMGILCMLAPGLTGISVILLIGILVLVAGILRIIWAFQAGSFSQGLLMFALAGLTLLCGVLLVANPLFASGVLTILLGIYFILNGIIEISAWIRLRPMSGSGCLLFSGIVSLVLGIMIWTQFPLSGAWAMGILLGINLFMTGLIMITSGSAVRSPANL